MKEKARLQDMDKEDQGCRHELLRIVKTIMRAETNFAKLTSYHLKTVFLHYNSDSRLQWSPDMLGKRFIEYMEMLYEALAQNWLSHFWLQESVNLFDDIPWKTLENMANRMRKILDNDKERRKVLKYEGKSNSVLKEFKHKKKKQKQAKILYVMVMVTYLCPAHNPYVVHGDYNNSFIYWYGGQMGPQLVKGPLEASISP